MFLVIYSVCSCETKYLQVRLERTQVKSLSPFLGMLLAFPLNIKLNWNGLAGSSTVTYYEYS